MQPLDASRRALVRLAALAAAALGVGPPYALADPASLDELAFELLQKMPSPLLHTFLNKWPQFSPRRQSHASSLPVLRYLPWLRAHAPPFSAALLDALTRRAANQTWRRSYSSPSVSNQFLENYGWTEFVGLSGPLASEELACGVLLLGPDTAYPAHHHEAEELYIPLSGVAAWQQGDGEWREQLPGTLVHHQRHQSHAMRTGPTPLVALYIWISADLSQTSQLDSGAQS